MRIRHARWSVAVVALLLQMIALGVVSAQPATQPKANPVLAAFQAAMAAERYAEAKEQANALARFGSPVERTAVSWAYGRILLGLGEKDAARKYLASIQKAGLGEEGKLLVKVCQAWLTALEGDSDSALKTLQNVMYEELVSVATAEAADVAAIICLKEGRRADAQKAVDFGLKFLQEHQIKTAYLEQILRGRMKAVPESDADRLYAAAEKLRQEKKFLEAGRAYTEVMGRFPQSKWAPAATFRVGQCLAALGEHQKAVAHWEAFLKASPAGPWRGQAHVAVIDQLLERQLDIPAATEHAATAGAILDNSKEGESEETWERARAGIRLRQGILELAAGRHDVAAGRFNEAQAALQSPSSPLGAGLKRVIKAAESKAPIHPPELADLAGQASAAVALGNIEILLGRPEQAKTFFELALSGKLRGTSKPHRSFAALGLARALRRLDQLQEASAAYRASLSEYGTGSWHDQTLRELALLIEGSARRKLAEASKAAEEALAAGKPPSGPSLAELTVAVASARREVLPHWSRLCRDYPTSRYLPEALYHTGSIRIESGDTAGAVEPFVRLTTDHPKSAWCGDAHVGLIDIRLERDLDLVAARRQLTSAVAWLDTIDEEAVGATRSAAVAEGAGNLRMLQQIRYNVYLRAGLLEFLEEQYATATAWFEKAQPFAPARSFAVVHGSIPTGIEKLIEIAKTGRSLTPQIVLDGDARSRIALMLADVYHEGEEWQRSLHLCTRVLDGDVLHATPEQRSWAFYVRGRNYYNFIGDEFQPDAALADYANSVKIAPQMEWADDALLLSANILWNHQQSPDAAIAVWRRLVKDYPQSEDADRAAYFVAVVYQWTDRAALAEKEFGEFLTKRPGSQFASDARKRLEEIQQAAANRHEEGQ